VKIAPAVGIDHDFWAGRRGHSYDGTRFTLQEIFLSTLTNLLYDDGRDPEGEPSWWGVQKKDAIAHYSLSDLDWTGFLPTSYAFDSTGDVYMALSGGRWYLQGRVAVYPPLPRSPYHETYSLHGPETTGPLALAVAPNDDLIVGNNGAVDVYAPRSQTLLFAITQGVGGQVTALAIETQ